MGGPEYATLLGSVLRIIWAPAFADGQGCAIFFKRTNEIATVPHRFSELIGGIGELKLKVVIGRLFPRQVEIDRLSFFKMLEAIARLTGIQQPVAEFLMTISQISPSL